MAVFCTAAAFSPALAATYYKVGGDGGGQSSFAGNVNTTDRGWSTTEYATKPDTSITFGGNDFVVGTNKNGEALLLRTPANSDANATFGGRTLTLKDGGSLALKRKTTNKEGTRTLTFTNLVVNSKGTITLANQITTFIFKGRVTLNDNSTLTVNVGVDGDPRGLTIDSALTGGETSAINVKSNKLKGDTATLVLGDAGGFYGTITNEVFADNESFKLIVTNGFSGTISSLPATTTTATFNYDGLPAGKGLQVATTDIPAALKTTLKFYSPTTDFSVGGIPLITFPAGTTVDPSEFTIKYATSVNGAGTEFKLDSELVENDDGTITLVSKIGNTYYKVGNDGKGQSSFSGNYSGTVGWALSSDASETTTISDVDWKNGTFIVGGGDNILLRTTEDENDETFGGRVLRLEDHLADNKGLALKKKADGTTITIPRLVSKNGRISAGDERSYRLAGKIDIESGSGLYLCAHDTGTRTIYVDSSIKGDATTKLVFPKHPTSSNTGTQVFHINSAADFLGEATVTADSTCTTELYINGEFGGSVGALGNTLSTLVVNYDKLAADKWLHCTATPIPDKLKTTLTFYSSDTAKFKQDKLPLVTFPAGTDVDPDDFTIKYAATRDGAATEIPCLTTNTAENGFVVLVVNVPETAQWDAVSGAWKFYDGDDNDLTEKCGLSEPNSTITVLIDSTEAAVHAAGIAVKECRLSQSFDLTGETDLTALNNLTIQDNYTIDLKGNKLTIGKAFFDQAGTITDSTGNGELHVNVAENTVNELVELKGGLKFVKEGKGRFCSKRSQSYTGGNEIVGGVFGPEPSSTKSGNQYITSNDCSYNAGADFWPLGASGSDIVVGASGTFDIGGNYGYGAYTVVLAGGTNMSSKADGAYVSQSDVTANGLGAFSLTADSTLRLRSDMVVNGWDTPEDADGLANPVNLGGHELFIYSPTDYKQLYWSKDIKNGTLRFGPCNNNNDQNALLVICGRDVNATNNVHFIDEGGIALSNNFSVCDYTAARTYSNSRSGGLGDLFVYGTFKPQEAYFWGCKMMDGSTIDLSGKIAAWSLTSAETKGDGKKNVEFADNATVAVKLGSRRLPHVTKLISWDGNNCPSNLGTLKFVSAEGERVRCFVKKNDGLYVASGFKMMVR